MVIEAVYAHHPEQKDALNRIGSFNESKKEKVAINFTCFLFSKSMIALKFCKARNLCTYFC